MLYKKFNSRELHSLASVLPNRLLRSFASCLPTAGVFSLSGMTAAVVLSAPTLAQQQFDLTYDSYGTPHVEATDANAAYFGAGYVAARDRLFQMWTIRLAGLGRMAEAFGPDSILLNPKDNPQVTGDEIITRVDGFKDQDVLLRTLGLHRESRRRASRMSASHATQFSYLESYAAGVNRYIADASAAQAAALAAGSTVEPDNAFDPAFATWGIDPTVASAKWNASDCILVWMTTAYAFDRPPLIDIANAGRLGIESANPVPPSERAPYLFRGSVSIERMATVREHEFDSALLQATSNYAQANGIFHAIGRNPGEFVAQFSEAAAVMGARVSDSDGAGQSYLWAGPRIGNGGPSTLFEWHMSCPEFSVRGAGVAGSPNMVSGSTAGAGDDKFIPVAWTLCSGSRDLSDVFKITPSPKYPDIAYTFAGAPRLYETRSETILSRVPGGGFDSITFDVKRTRFGPILPEDISRATYTSGVTGTNDTANAGMYGLRNVANIPDGDPMPLYAVASSFMVDLGLNDGQQSDTPFLAFDAMYRASGLVSFVDAVKESYSYPGANMTLSDGAGNIGYTTTGAMPVRRAALEDVNDERTWAPYLPNDGSLLAHQWQGYVPSAFRPWAMNPDKGYFTNGNSPGFWSDHPLGAYYGGIGEQDERGFELRRFFIERLLTATDTVSASDLEEFAARRTRRTSEMLAEIIDYCATNQPGSMEQSARRYAKRVITWASQGGELDGGSEGAVLANVFNPSNNAFEAGFASPSSALGRARLSLLPIYGDRNKGVMNFIEEMHRGIQPNGGNPTLSLAELLVVNEMGVSAVTAFDRLDMSTSVVQDDIDAFVATNISRLANKGRMQRYWNRIFGGGLPVGPNALGATPDSIIFANDPVSMDTNTLAGVLGATYNAFTVLDGPDATRRKSMLGIGTSEKSHPLQPIDPFDGQLGLLEQGLYKPAPCVPAPANGTPMSRDITVVL